MTKYKSETPTMPFGVPIIPEGANSSPGDAAQAPSVPQEPFEARTGVAAQAITASQLPDEGKEEDLQYVEAMGFIRCLFPQKSEIELEQWIDNYVAADPRGIIVITCPSNNIESSSTPVRFPQKLAIRGNLAIWPNKSEIKIGEYTHITGNLVIIGNPKIVFPQSTAFYVDGNVSYSRTTPPDVVKRLIDLKRMGQIKGRLSEV